MLGKIYLTHKGVLLLCAAAVPTTAIVTHENGARIHRAVVRTKHQVNRLTRNVINRDVFVEPRVRVPRIETDLGLCPPAGGYGYGGSGFSYGGFGGSGGGYYGGGSGGGGFGAGGAGGGVAINPAPPVIPGGAIFTPSVPETSTWIAMTTGMAAVGGSLRYRRKMRGHAHG